jgi:hypothetical protein
MHCEERTSERVIGFMQHFQGVTEAAPRKEEASRFSYFQKDI